MKKTLYMAAVLSILLIFAGTPVASAFDVARPDRTQELATPEADVEGTWTLAFTWDGSSTGYTTITFTQIGPFFKFSTGDGNSGLGITLGPVIAFIIRGGCSPIYTGRVSGDFMEGKMRCTQGDDFGTWEATRGEPQFLFDGFGRRDEGVSSAGP